MKFNEPLISVIMNCKNGENIIYESVGSLLNKSYQLGINFLIMRLRMKV